MADRRFMVGERVLASRDQSGENHEEATVYDFYELLIGNDKTPQVAVDFDDGQRVYMVARPPNVLPIEVDEDDEPDLDSGDTAEDVIEGDGARNELPHDPGGGEVV